MVGRCAPAASSAGSADSTRGSPEQGLSMLSSASPTSGDGASCASGSPECPSTTTCATFIRATRPHGARDGSQDDERWEESPVTPPLTPHGQGSVDPALVVSISSAEASPARTCQSPDNGPGSPGNDPACSSSSPVSPGLFDPDGFSSRTYPASSPRTAVGTSEACLERWPTSGTAWPGGFSTAVTSECRSDDAGCSSSEPSLTEILEPPQRVPARYLLSARAAQGILRRAEKRGRVLPSHLSAALEQVARMTTMGKEGGS